MAYSTSNPPFLMSSDIGGQMFRFWGYKSTDAEAAFDDANYITNAKDIGMNNGDVVLIVDTTNNLSSIAKVIVNNTTGTGTLSPLTAIT